MQQTQAQLPTPTKPSKRKRRRVSRNVIVGIACAVALVICCFWIATAIGWIPTLLGISPTNLTLIASIVVAVLSALFTFIPVVPVDEEPEQPVTPTPQNIIIQMPPYQTTPAPVSSPSPTPTIPAIYRGIASQPPSTNTQTVQQRETVVMDVYTKLTQPDISALVHLISTLDTPLLIVLDQFENLLNLNTGEALTPETGELLDALNSRSCLSRILLTSRPRPKGTRGNVAGNLFVYLINGLTVPEGQALLTQRGVKGTEEDLQTAVKRCKGHGYALDLLASLLDENKISLSTLLKDASYTQLWDDDIATNLLNAIYTQRLNNKQRELIQALSIYREAVPQDAILPLVSNITQTNIVALFRTLQSQQLVQVVEEAHRQLHPIVATYAQHHDEQFNKASMHTAHGKAAQYYIQKADKTCPVRDKHRSVQDVQPLIEAVWQLCQAQQWEQAYELMPKEDLFEDLSRWGGNIILLELCQSLLSGNWQPELRQASIIYGNIAIVYRTLGKNHKALEYLQKDLQVNKDAGDRWGEGTTLNNLGSVYDALGQQQEALNYFEQALVIKKEVGDRRGAGITLNNLGKVYDDLGQQQEALNYYGQALAIKREVRDRRGEGTTLWNIGVFYQSEKRYDVALSAFILAQSIFVEVQSPDSKDVQEEIDGLQQEIGDEQFTDLLKNVKPQAQQIVDRALQEL